MAGCLVVPADPDRVVAGPDVRGERDREIAGGMRVQGDLGGRGGRFGVLQGLEKLSVQPSSLAGQQVVVHGLGQQGMPEPVAVLPIGHQHLLVDGRAQGAVENARVQPGHLGEERIGRVRSGARHRADDRGRLVVEPVDAHQQQFGQCLRQHRVGAGVTEFLGVERVARCPPDDRPELGTCGFAAAGPDQVDDVTVGERAELEAADARHPGPLRDRLPQRMAPVQVVGAVADDEVHRVGEPAGQQEPQQLAGGAVRPVRVLDDQQQRLVDREQVEPRDHGGEQLGAVDPDHSDPRVGRHRRTATVRERLSPASRASVCSGSSSPSASTNGWYGIALSPRSRQ